MADRGQYIQLVPGVEFESGFANPEINRISTITIRMTVLLFVCTITNNTITVFTDDESRVDVANWGFGIFINVLLLWAGITGIKYKNPSCCCGCSRLYCYYFWNMVNAFVMALQILLLTSALIFGTTTGASDQNEPSFDSSTAYQEAEGLTTERLILWLSVDVFLFVLMVLVLRNVRKIFRLLFEQQATERAARQAANHDAAYAADHPDDVGNEYEHAIALEQIAQMESGQPQVAVAVAEEYNTQAVEASPEYYANDQDAVNAYAVAPPVYGNHNDAYDQNEPGSVSEAPVYPAMAETTHDAFE